MWVYWLSKFKITQLNLDPIHYIQLACLIASSFCYFMANDFINSMFFLCSILIWFRFSLDLMLRSRTAAAIIISKSGHQEEMLLKFIFEKIKYLHRNWSHRGIIFQHPLLKNLDTYIFSWLMNYIYILNVLEFQIIKLSKNMHMYF